MNIKVLETDGMRVLTTKQIAEAYDTNTRIISKNFRRNIDRYTEGKHYIFLTGKELENFKKSSSQIDDWTKASKLYLWTEKGALLHAKSIGTDKAWEVYDYLVDFYFRAKEQKVAPAQPEAAVPKAAGQRVAVVKAKPMERLVVDTPDNMQIQEAMKRVRNDLTCMDVLLRECNRYISKEDYLKAQETAAAVLGVLLSDFTRFQIIKPREITKNY